MKIDFKNPRYALPLIILPFLFIFFYIYKTGFAKTEIPISAKDSLQAGLADVSQQVKEKSLSDKLEAYRNSYKDADGYTAVENLREELLMESENSPVTPYSQRERHMLDSLDRILKTRAYARERPGFPDLENYPVNNESALQQDRALARALQSLQDKQQQDEAPVQTVRNPDPDPIEIFRKQMQLMDSMGKANDPEYQQKLLEQKLEHTSKPPETVKWTVKKVSYASAVFNTVSPAKNERFLSAIIDQDTKGYAGSRIRIRLLEDMMVGNFLVKKGTYIYAQITGFSAQRVILAVKSILNGGQILPVKIDVYDHDGIPGLYVPASAFRELSRDLGGNATQGFSLQKAAENNSQLVMSLVQKMFQSTSTAISKMVRQNRANLKYGTIVYLIDPQQLPSQ